MVKERIDEIGSNINRVMNDVRQSDLLKNVAVGDCFLKMFGQNKEDIPFLQLAGIPIGKRMLLPSVKGGSIVTTNITKITNGECLYFEVSWTAGATLIFHKHSDAEEVIKVRKGIFQIITEDPNGERDRFKVISGDKVNIGAGQYHQVTALEKGMMTIKFTKI